MAYITGVANSATDLLTAIQTTCVTNGWTLDGSVLHKGACYAEVTVSGGLIKLQSGTGVDGSNALTGRSSTPAAYLGTTIWFATAQAFSWPCTYDIFIGTTPDEVYVHVTFSVTCHQQIGWGLSLMPGLAGTGNWYAGASVARGSYGYSGVGYQYPGVETIVGGSGQAISLLAQDNALSCGVDHALDGPSWIAAHGALDNVAIYARQPNQWDGEAILMPVRCYAPRSAGFFSPVLECAHLRYVNLANLVDGQIITLGADQWMVFPFARRGGITSSPGTGSQLAGHAFRYDGP